MELKIKYENGSMTVHLEEFLNCRSISKVKKLVKLIRHSVNPDDVGKIRMFIEQEIEQFEPKQQENQRYIIEYTEKVKFCQKQLDNALYNRSQYKKSTPLHKSDGWEHYNVYVKQLRQEMREIKARLRSRQSDVDKNIRNKEFYKKVRQIIT